MTDAPGPSADGAGRAGRLTVRCACGWEWAGDVEAIVAAAEAHDRTAHSADTVNDTGDADDVRPPTPTAG